MIYTLNFEQTIGNGARSVRNYETFYKKLWHICLLGVVAFVALQLWRNGPDPALLAWIMYTTGVVTILIRPRYGLYLIAFFGLVGDHSLMYWYPFEKNLSSAESLLYLHDSLIISPLESYIGLTVFAWLGRVALKERFKFFAGELFFPALLFGVLVAAGLMYGMATGGSALIALWESRPIFYLPVMLIATSNLIQERGQIKWLLWLCFGAIFVESLIGSYIFFFELGGSLGGIDRLSDHSAAIHINTFFVFVISTWLYRTGYAKRLALFLMMPPLALNYLASQRRAAFVTLAVALIFIAIMLYIENRQAFWLLAPIVAVFGIVYIGVFWNSNSAAALPVQAIRSVIAPDPNSTDTASNVYRVIENVNINYTIHESPLFGVGFGKKFFVVVPMADISFFDWWEYIVHNSIFWFWLKTGVFGFMSMLFLICSGIMVGVRVVRRLSGGELNAIALTCTLYVIMHFMYAYVDMSWDNQSMLYVGICLGLLNCFEHVMSKPTSPLQKRWHWQPDPEPETSLLPLPYETVSEAASAVESSTVAASTVAASPDLEAVA